MARSCTRGCPVAEARPADSEEMRFALRLSVDLEPIQCHMRILARITLPMSAGLISFDDSLCDGVPRVNGPDGVQDGEGKTVRVTAERCPLLRWTQLPSQARTIFGTSASSGPLA
jgi:hypothetical protein